jgi:hypothetical protein
MLPNGVGAAVVPLFFYPCLSVPPPLSYVLQGDMLVAQLPPSSPWVLHQVVGLLLWGCGWAANLHSDHILRNLRRGPADKGEGGSARWSGGGGCHKISQTWGRC